MLSIFLFLTSASSAVLATSSLDDDYACAISINYKNGDLQEPQPLILDGESNPPNFIYPQDNEGTLKFRAGQAILLSCPGKGNSLVTDDVTTPKAQTTKIFCERDKIFNVNGQSRNFSSLTCRKLPFHDAKRSGSCLSGRHSLLEIGFNITSRFLRVMEICRDDSTYVTYYSRFQLVKQIGGGQRGYPRPRKWLGGTYYPNMDVNQAYIFENQESSLAKILNSTELVKKYLRKSVQFLARGHTAAKADFVYGAQQLATFWHLNAAPQWQSFNGGNWNSLEFSVRELAATRGLDLHVYTGVHGQMTLIDAQDARQPIRLHAIDDDQGLIVPGFYWKIIYDPVTKLGTAFIGVNDPFLERITGEVYLCEDISGDMKWLTWHPKDIHLGISYACTIAGLRKAVPTLPLLEVVGVLK